MKLISTFIIWTCLLGTSLLIPISLPAGGAQRFKIEHSEHNIRSPLIALKEFNLMSSASFNSSVLTNVKAGTPVKVLKVWDSPETGKWLLINVISQNYYQLFYKRGWLHITTT